MPETEHVVTDSKVQTLSDVAAVAVEPTVKAFSTSSPSDNHVSWLNLVIIMESLKSAPTPMDGQMRNA